MLLYKCLFQVYGFSCKLAALDFVFYEVVYDSMKEWKLFNCTTYQPPQNYPHSVMFLISSIISLSADFLLYYPQLKASHEYNSECQSSGLNGQVCQTSLTVQKMGEKKSICSIWPATHFLDSVWCNRACPSYTGQVTHSAFLHLPNHRKYSVLRVLHFNL